MDATPNHLDDAPLALGAERRRRPRPALSDQLAPPDAEAVYTGSSTIPNGLEFLRDVKARAVAPGRAGDSIRVLPGITSG